MTTGGSRQIKVPREWYDQANALRMEHKKQKGYDIPLWRCIIALEKTQNSKKTKPPRGGFL